MSKENRRKEMIKTIMEYSNEGVLDISKFRNENQSLYNSIPYYFGSIDSMLNELSLVRVRINKANKNVSLRDRLAYDMLVELRKSKTLEVIANEYGVSRALINQLYKALDTSIKCGNIKEELDN